ncbi:MAG: anhydro-N-acetylmuramic acid kinase [Alphaproteobacteria bacterium]|nr:anhydro-N-acetylmuramic acid kinase [Alphaproteobacteria bacterium]
MKALGLMSGTSLDGIDVALIDTDGETVEAFGPWMTLPYDRTSREAIRAALGRRDEVEAVADLVTIRHAEAVFAFLGVHGLSARDLDLIGFHGQTILHRPEERLTRQIGDGARLARLIGVNVVGDFRSADVAAGGQGAPLVPLYHQALAARLDKPLAILNLGGVGNVTWLGRDDSVIAFDTGPGNALIDDWCLAKTGFPFDPEGRYALAGAVRGELVGEVLKRPFFDRPAPKSLDRDDFAGIDVSRLSLEDGAATLAEITAAAVAAGLRWMPEPPRRWLVSGGGRRNRALMAALARLVPGPVPVESVGWRGDALEAEAFAFLALRSVRGLPLSLPTTTGVPRPMTGGRLFRAPLSP